MIKNLFSFLRYFLFWYFIFIAGRFAFIFFNADEASNYLFIDLTQTFIYGFWLDISITAYVCVIPLFIWYVMQWAGEKKWLKQLLYSYSILMLIAVSALIVIDAELYRFWGQKLNSYATSFAKFPKEMMVFSSGASIAKPLAFLLVLTLLVGVFYKMLLPDFFNAGLAVKKLQASLLLVVSAALLMLFIRGGLGKATINQSSAFFSDKPFLNHTAINTTWNFMSRTFSPLETTHNPYTFIDAAEADSLLTVLLEKNNVKESVKFTNAIKPNILFIILEGWGADVVAACGGETDVTPELNRIISESYFFNRFYANGNRTDKGLASVLSAQPALANSSIINHIEKYTSMPALPAVFANNGYSSSFYYGGDSKFANMKGYLLSIGIKNIFDLDEYPLSERNAEWGVHDDLLYKNMLSKLDKQQQPFFSVALTLSSHEPFRIPVTNKFSGKDDANDYRASVRYADSCLGNFYNQIRNQAWFDNTLIFIVADHGHRHPHDRPAQDPQRYHIPFLIGGGALKKELRGKQNSRLAAQVDIASTLLKQLNYSDSAFKWSRDMMDTTTQGFASYVLHDAIGSISDSVELVFDQESKQLIYFKGNVSEYRKQYFVKRTRAYEQVFYDEFIKR